MEGGKEERKKNHVDGGFPNKKERRRRMEKI